LLDVYSAEESEGQTISNWEWRFLHFGPYSNAAIKVIDDLVTKRQIKAEEKETKSGDKEFVLYDIAEYQKAKNLRELGIAGSIQLRIQADIKRYSRDLPGILNHVYFRTEPMASASPGEILDFSGCRKVDSKDFNSVTMRLLRHKAIKKTREQLRELIKARKESQQPITQGTYDNVYFSVLKQLDGEPLETGVQGKAELKVD
jgi:hypothetical protein